MLEILKGEDLYDVCAVVTRYFGGTLLGTGGLVRAYSDSLKEALAFSELAEVVPGVQVKITCGYSLAEKIKRAAINMKLHTLNEEYAADCTLTYLVRSEAAETFAAKVTEISLGQVEAEIGDEILFADGEKPYLYTDQEEDQ